MSELLAPSLVWHDAGCCVIPASPDGTKRPFGEWKTYQQRRSTPDELATWFSNGRYDGLGLVCGAVSGNLEQFEVEGRDNDLGEMLGKLMAEHGYADLWRRITDGYLERTPSGGYHWLLRVDGPARPNTKLARRPATPAELATNPDDRVKVLIETRGEGGFTIVAPSGGRTHPTGGSWTVVLGSLGSIPTVTEDERDALYAIATLLDQMPAPDPAPARPHKDRTPGDLRPGDDYNDRATWDEVLTPHGWAHVRTFGQARAWRRPGKTVGISATTGRNDADNLYVFSSSTVFDTETPFTKFAAYALLEHGGDYSAAARDLAGRGYGTRHLTAVPPVTTLNLDGTSALAPQAQVADAPAADAHAERVAYELATLRARHDAKRAFDAEQATLTFRAPDSTPTLTHELALPEEQVTYAVAELLPTGANALLAAQYKTGKTTLVTNLLKAYADNEPFLGRFAVAQHPGRIAIFNYELTRGQYNRWLREANITNTDRVAVLHLRGHRLPLTSPLVEDWVVTWLRDHDVAAWIIDPLARAATGIDENSNTDMGVWLDTIDVIKARAGVSEAYIPTHTGRAEMDEGKERARGATRLDDWADVRWILTKNDDDQRFFRATGRDVELAEELLTYNEHTRQLTYGGGDRQWVARRALEDTVVAFVQANPGCSKTTVETSVSGRAEKVRAALDAAVSYHRLRAEPGPKNSTRYFANAQQTPSVRPGRPMSSHDRDDPVPSLIEGRGRHDELVPEKRDGDGDNPWHAPAPDYPHLDTDGAA